MKKSKPWGYWTEANCLAVIKTMSTRKEFAAGPSGMRTKCSKHGWHKELIRALPIDRTSKKIIWTLEKVMEASKTCLSRSEFHTRYPGAYGRAKKQGWLNQVFEHMEVIGNLCNRAVYAFEFEDKSVYVGLTLNIGNRFSDHVNNGRLKLKIAEHPYVFKIISDGYIEVRQAQAFEAKAVNDYRDAGWVVLNRQKAGGLGGNLSLFDEQDCLDLAKNFANKAEFRSAHPGRFGLLQRRHLISKVSHWPVRIAIRPKYTREECESVAASCASRKEFRVKHKPFYHFAVKQGFYKAITSHLPNSSTAYRTDAIEVWGIATKYDTRMSFCRAHPNLYSFILRNGLAEACFSHMPLLRGKRR